MYHEVFPANARNDYNKCHRHPEPPDAGFFIRGTKTIRVVVICDDEYTDGYLQFDVTA